MDIPLHTLMKLTPKAYGTVTEKVKADIPAVSTWRPQGSTAKHHDSLVEGEATQMPGMETPPTPRAKTPVHEVEVQGTVLGVTAGEKKK